MLNALLLAVNLGEVSGSFFTRIFLALCASEPGMCHSRRRHACRDGRWTGRTVEPANRPRGPPARHLKPRLKEAAMSIAE